MTKAYPLPPNDETINQAPRVACDFCQSTYNLKTGEPVSSQESKGILGGIAKAVLRAQESGSLKTYQLGEKNGKIMFNLDTSQ
jgi:nitrite reductase/ring-hydroxylating ferredoxin subunit